MDVENILLNQNHRDPYISNIGELYQFTVSIYTKSKTNGSPSGRMQNYLHYQKK